MVVITFVILVKVVFNNIGLLTVAGGVDSDRTVSGCDKGLFIVNVVIFIVLVYIVNGGSSNFGWCGDGETYLNDGAVNGPLFFAEFGSDLFGCVFDCVFVECGAGCVFVGFVVAVVVEWVGGSVGAAGGECVAGDRGFGLVRAFVSADDVFLDGVFFGGRSDDRDDDAGWIVGDLSGDGEAEP